MIQCDQWIKSELNRIGFVWFDKFNHNNFIETCWKIVTNFTSISSVLLPISLAVCISFSGLRAISTTLRPRLANSLPYSLPIPSVAPVITANN